MRGHNVRFHFGAWAFFGAAAAWPSLFGFAADLMRTPLERALLSSWCGTATHSDHAIFAHCAPCWEGSALLALAGAALLMRAAPSRSLARRRL